MSVTKSFKIPKVAVPLERCYWVVENLLLAGAYPGHPNTVPIEVGVLAELDAVLGTIAFVTLLLQCLLVTVHLWIVLKIREYC